MCILTQKVIVYKVVKFCVHWYKYFLMTYFANGIHTNSNDIHFMLNELFGYVKKLSNTIHNSREFYNKT